MVLHLMAMKITDVLSQFKEYNASQSGSADEIIGSFFRTHVCSDIQIKKFGGTDNIFLVCSPYTATSTSDVYRECRSFVVALENDNLRLVSFSRESMTNVKVTDFVPAENDVYEEILEGTSVMAFNFENKWYFCTSRCTHLDKSFFNPKKTFGEMFDECLQGLTREEFEHELDRNLCYEFLIVHHENKFVKNYQDRFGLTYANMLTVNINLVENNVVTRIEGQVLDFKRPQQIPFDTNIKDNILCIRHDVERNSHMYFNIMSESYILQCARNPNYSNPYLCVLQIFLNNDKEYTISQYMNEHNIDKELTIGYATVDWVGMFCVLYKHTSQLLMNIVLHFTDFDFEKQSFSKKNDEDYKKLNVHTYSILKKQMSLLQYLFRTKRFTKVEQICRHLRNNLKPNEFVKLLKSIVDIKSINVFNYPESFYSAYANRFIELSEQ